MCADAYLPCVCACVGVCVLMPVCPLWVCVCVCADACLPCVLPGPVPQSPTGAGWDWDVPAAEDGLEAWRRAGQRQRGQQGAAHAGRQDGPQR